MTGAEPSKNGLSVSTLLRLLTAKERRTLAMLFPAVVVVALTETLGIASIAPFIALLADPTIVDRQPLLGALSDALAFSTRERFFFFVGLVVMLVLTVGNALGALTTWALLRFSWMRNHSLSMRLLDGYLQRPYADFLQLHSSELGQKILSEVQHVVTGVVVAAIQLAARAVTVVAILAVVVVVDPLMALLIGGVFGGLYVGVTLIVQKRIVVIGAQRLEANRDRFKLASEMLAGIKEVKLAGLEKAFLKRFEEPSLRFARAIADSNTLGQAPRFALETIAFGGVLVTVLLWMLQERPLDALLPVLGLYAFGAYRLLPALQIVFMGVSSLRAHTASLHALVKDLPVDDERSVARVVDTILPFERDVALEAVSFTYAGSSVETVHDVDLTIARGTWIALVGPTGSGKSTLIDLLLGLLEPTRGRVRVDDVEIDRASIPRWQKNAGYVPQQTFLADDTVARNIAFGDETHVIDRARLVEVARIAQIHDFIERELPNGYETEVGERGVRLSGGQRQRLGIARALYRRPRFLVLDEATSALDNDTEARFFTALRAALTDVTVVSIAHRLTTTRDFDRVIVVDGGRIVDAGTFGELALRHPHFRSVSQGERAQVTQE